MDLNHRFPGCDPGVLPARPRDRTLPPRPPGGEGPGVRNFPVAEVGVEPTESQALDLLALPVCVLGRQSRVQELHLAGRDYEPRPGLRPPAAKLQAPVSSRAAGLMR